MILKNGHSTNYLTAYRDGKIKKGLELGIELDQYLVFKHRQMNIILGHDNVGKSLWTIWYFLCLSLRHQLRWVLWMGENSSGQVMRDLITMYLGKPFSDCSHKEIRRAEMKMEHYFEFVDNSKLYKPEDLLKIFENTEADGCFIDPYTGLDRGFQHSDNYDFLNKSRLFCNQTGKTLYVSTHPNTESGRQGNVYPDKHDWAGHLKAPLKASIEGGKPFLNRCDDMIVIHRLVKHPTMKYYTMIEVEKIKDRDSGGQPTEYNMPLLFHFNFGLGFLQNDIDPISGFRRNQIGTNGKIEF